MEKEIKGVKLSEEQQKNLLKYKEKLIDNSSQISEFLNKILEINGFSETRKALGAHPCEYIVYMSESIFNFVYGLYRSNDNRYCKLIAENTFTYNSFIEGMDIFIDECVNDYYSGCNLTFVFDAVFNCFGQLTMVYDTLEKYHECCLKKGIKNTPKNFNFYDLESFKTYTLYNDNPAASKVKTTVFDKTSRIIYRYSEIVGYQASSYFSNINNTISLYNIIKDNKKLQQIFGKLENLHFKKETKNTEYSIRHNFVRPVKNEKGEFIAFYNVCFIENKEDYDIVRIEPYVFMPNISVNESKIPERFNNLINQKNLSRFETINLLVNYNLLLLLNNECNLNMTKDNMDIDKISLWFGGRKYIEPTFVDLLTDYNKPLYSFEEMDNILKNEALNVLGNGNQELLDAVIKDTVFYLKVGDIQDKRKHRFDFETAIEKAKNCLFSKINICDDNFSFVIAQMYRYMSDGFIGCMNSSRLYDQKTGTEIEVLSNNYVPTKAAITLMLARYYEYYVALCRLEGAVVNREEIMKFIDKLYIDDKNLAFELKELAMSLYKAHYSFLSFDGYDSILNKDYVLDQYENYPSNIWEKRFFIYNKWYREAQRCEEMLIKEKQIPYKIYKH